MDKDLEKTLRERINELAAEGDTKAASRLADELDYLQDSSLDRNPDPLLDVPQAAEYLGTTQRHMRLLTSQCAITVTRVGNKVRFRKSVLNTYITTRTTPAKVAE